MQWFALQQFDQFGPQTRSLLVTGPGLYTFQLKLGALLAGTELVQGIGGFCFDLEETQQTGCGLGKLSLSNFHVMFVGPVPMLGPAVQPGA